MRYHGYHGRWSARPGIFGCSHAGIPDGRLPVPGGMDFFCIRDAPDTDNALYFLPGELDHYIYSAHHLLYRDPETDCGAQKAAGLNCKKRLSQKKGLL